MSPEDIARLRTLPLETVLQSLGARRDPKDPAHNWRFGASRITVTESRFYDHNGAGALHRMREGRAGGGGAIDLVQYLKDVDFREAVRTLGELGAGRAAATPASSATQSQNPVQSVRPPPIPAPDRTVRAYRYLTEIRAIPEALVAEEVHKGRVFADARGNVVFRLRDETGREIGYEVRGTHEKPYHSVHGEKGVFVTKADGAKTAAFVESAIEALSYRALRGTGLVLSTTGSAIERPATLGQALVARGFTIVAAFNADVSGDRMSQRLSEALGRDVRRDRPAGLGKDWNDELKALRAARLGADPGVAAARESAPRSSDRVR